MCRSCEGALFLHCIGRLLEEYSSEHGEERAYVLDNLKLLANRLKNAASISVGYVRAHGLSILKRLEERFAGIFTEESAKASARALWELIKGFF